ncbi:winged helix-turn-helix domain-containing protein [Clostridium sp.]|uniref:winged helix-turn-helix domain-containing protein n=1 Tax=Clostridium sp. TaxID=1506 RepID=UPI0025BF051C|nr:winged helix-turn-helix domain-containing protein [Clostridium sp.]MCI7083379.1 winged helix-turn-helix domain-containing protein [Mycoplasmatota bacterium]
MKGIDFSKLSTFINELLILKILLFTKRSDISKINYLLSIKGVTELSYHNVYKILLVLVEKGLVVNNEGSYELTTEGKEKIKELEERFNKIKYILLEENWEVSSNKNESVSDEVLNLLQNVISVKIIPYTTKVLCEDDDKFFLETVCNRGYYDFEGRGLGKGDFKNTVVMFVNSNYAFFVGKIDRYIDDGQKKRIYFVDGKVFKFNIGISAKDISNALGYDFRFIRNKQTFSSPEDINNLIDLIKKHL